MTNQLVFLIIALFAAIVLFIAVPSIHANADTMTPEIHKCIHDKISEAITHAVIIAIGDLSGGGDSSYC
jgi:YbbR domain-containing protein